MHHREATPRLCLPTRARSRAAFAPFLSVRVYELRPLRAAFFRELREAKVPSAERCPSGLTGPPVWPARRCRRRSHLLQAVHRATRVTLRMRKTTRETTPAPGDVNQSVNSTIPTGAIFLQGCHSRKTKQNKNKTNSESQEREKRRCPTFRDHQGLRPIRPLPLLDLEWDLFTYVACLTWPWLRSNLLSVIQLSRPYVGGSGEVSQLEEVSPVQAHKRPIVFCPHHFSTSTPERRDSCHILSLQT